MKVAVIGGGWAGLAAAVELAAAGAQVCVFEAAGQLGGRARRVVLDGHVLDNGQHLLLGAYCETLRLIRLVGADPERLCQRLPLTIDFPAGERDAAFRLRLPRLPAPWHLLVGLLRARGVGLRSVWSTLRFMRRLQGKAYRLPDDETVSTLLDRHDQHGAMRHFLWEPLCLAALNTAPEQASAQVFLHTLRDSLGGTRAATDLLLPTVDLESLWPAAAARFICAHGGAIHVRSRVRTIDEPLGVAGERFAAVILAVAPQHAAALLQGHPLSASTVDLLAAYTYEPIATLYCAYPPEVRLPTAMLGLAPYGDDALGQWVFDRGTLCGTPGMLAFVLSGSGAWQAVDEATLATRLHGELRAALRRPLPAFTWNRMIREQRATFACRPALPRPAARSARPGLWLAGDYVCAEYPATLEAAMRSGVAAATGILREQHR